MTKKSQQNVNAQKKASQTRKQTLEKKLAPYHKKDGQYHCPKDGCDRKFPQAQGLGVHISR